MIMLVFTIMYLVCISGSECQAKVKSGSCKTKKINLRVNETYKIRHKKNIKYISSKTKVASVSKKGLIKAKKKGHCVIKVNEYYIFDSKEWQTSLAGHLESTCKYIKIKKSKDNIINTISVGDKVSVKLAAEYTMAGENAIFETGITTILPI